MDRRIVFAVLVVVVAGVVQRSLAVCKATIPVSGSYKSAQVVVVAKVTKFNPETGSLEAASTTLKGSDFGPIVRLRISKLPDVTKKIKEGAPLVLFIAKSQTNYALHLGDTWLLPVPQPNSTKLFLVNQTSEAALRQSYPGTTTALVKLVEDLKAEKSTMLNEASPDMFKGGPKDLGKLPGAPFSSLSAFKITGKSYLVATAGGSISFFEPTPAGLQPAKGDIQRPEPKLTLEKAGGDAKSLAGWVDGDFGEDRAAPAILAIKEDAIIRLPDNSDFTRMTGEHLATYFRDQTKPFTGAQVCSLDCNGDGRLDLVVATPGRTLLLINRGFGAFFVNADIGKLLVDAAGQSLITPKTRIAGLDVDADGLDDLVIVSETGAATAILNPKPAPR